MFSEFITSNRFDILWDYPLRHVDCPESCDRCFSDCEGATCEDCNLEELSVEAKLEYKEHKNLCKFIKNTQLEKWEKLVKEAKEERIKQLVKDAVTEFESTADQDPEAEAEDPNEKALNEYLTGVITRAEKSTINSVPEAETEEESTVRKEHESREIVYITLIVLMYNDES